MSDYESSDVLKDLTLGQKTTYCSSYDAEILQAVPRYLNRQELGIVNQQPFVGVDVWHAYELSWLNAKGKPVVALARCTVPCNTPNIIESKSFKLYLNSFNQSRFESKQTVLDLLVKDLSDVAGGEVLVELFNPEDIQAFQTSVLPGKCIDNIDIEIKEYDLKPSLLALANEDHETKETIHSHLLKSNCLITNQPDWASVIISYTGNKIDHVGLLRYLISFRMHNEFHEQCVERIFMDIMTMCLPTSLTVQALYTRRGGLDINPLRSTEMFDKETSRRTNRQ
ncbi:MAG: NADPH-dependent 7-cyano-7-deazaguanine reductase QueF [Arenicella sp.]